MLYEVITFSDSITVLVAPGFEAQDRLLVAKILRLLAFSPILFAASNALGAILITRGRFFFYGLSPILYNLGIILGTVFLVPHWGVMGVAIGTLFGAALHFLSRLWDAWQQGFRFKPKYDFKNPQFKKTLVITSYSIHYTKLYDAPLARAWVRSAGLTRPSLGK